MNNIMTKLFTVIMLMMFSMGAYADVKVLFGENGDDVFSGKGGTIEVSQEPDEKDETKVIVTLTVTPKKNYSISKDDIKVYAVLPASVRSTRGLEISNELTLDGNDPQNLSEKRDYTVTLDSKLNLWVRTATFTNLRKDGEITVTYHIINLGRLNDNGQLTTNRTEALKFTVTGNNVTVGMPEKYKSPLAKNFAYYSSSTLESSLNVGDALSDGDHVYVTYELDEDAFSTVDLEDGGIYRILFSNGKYFKQTTYNKEINANSYEEDNPTGSEFLLQLNIKDPYQITIQTRSSACLGYYLSATSDANFGNVRFINTLSTAQNNKVWTFALLNGDTSGTYRLVVADGMTQSANTDGRDEFGHGYLNNNDTGYKIRYHKYGSSDYSGCDLRFIPLKTNYTYNIVDTQGHIAIKYTVNNQDVGLALNNDYTSIPEAIRSPYLEDETVTFYKAFTEGSRDNLLDANVIESTPAVERNIYVSYTITPELLDAKPLHLRGARPFMMQVNGEYVYDQNKNLMHSSTDGGEADNYRWVVTGGDPYRVQIYNVDDNRHHFKWSTDPSPSLTLGAVSNFILFGGSVARPSGVPEDFTDQVELMAATGEDISSSTYYNVGRVNDVGLLPSGDYSHGHAAIQVLLKAVQRTTTFHIIDMSGRIVVEQSGEFTDLDVPDQWKSPLVETYHFYKHEDFRVHDGVYTLRSGVTPITDFASAPADIYVTYDPNNTYDLDGSENRATDGKKYLLKFVSGTKFNQEKDDGFEATSDWGIYPYINGEGGLFVYGQDKLDATEGAVGSTRTRWAWYLEGGDPYRLRISSLQTKTDGKEESHHSYLRTYKPKGYTEVVTGVISNNPSVYDDSDDAHAVRHKPTDYMILNGDNGHFKLVTSDVVDDLDGNASNDVRHTVTSFENYWKTNPTAANVIHDYDNSFTAGEDTPSDAQMTDALVTGKGWHTYNVWANGSTWASSSKSFGYGPHWFQTIGVGTETAGSYNGDFDLEEYELDGALILLDQHGWEVMRKPITNRTSDKEDYATELRKYDSPMVKKYHFWTNFRKDDGYHKYKPIRDQSDSKKNAQHKGEGTSLADYPEVFSGGTLSDLYVTYEVMATYRGGYKPKAENQNERVSKYLIRQGENYAKTTDGTNITLEPVADVPDVSAADPELLWYVKPNVNIDTEMGYHYSGDGVAKYGEKSQADTESDYYTNTTEEAVYDKTNGQNGFDPYNLQIESAKVEYSGKLFTTNATGAGLDGSGGLVSTYEGAKTLGLQEYTPVFNVTNYYDSGTGYQIPHVTNSTFMAVSDDNGNIRLMPRFDHHNVVESFATLETQQNAKPYGDEKGTQTTLFVLPSTSSQIPSGTPITISSSDEITDMNGYYLFDEDKGFDVTKVIGTKANPFRGTIDGKLITIDGVGRPLVAYAEGATIKNVIVKTASINAGNADNNAGAICCQATGDTRIYNCGVLPTTTERDDEGNVTGFTGSHVIGSANVGGIVGLISGNTRVINCFSYANVSGGTMMGGIVGNNAVATNADATDTDHYLKTMVMNCMFYGNITGGSRTTMKPVYGGQVISNAGATGINGYNYYRNGKDVTFDDGYTGFADYYCTLPADEEYLTRFEYYRSILNSNRQLCTYWVTDKKVTSTDPNEAVQTAADTALIAKWVLDQEIAPYPILKKWGKYPSVINQDKEYVWNPKTQQKVSRASAEPYQGKKLGTISVTVNAGAKHAGDGATTKLLSSEVVMDMDTLNHDYCYAKIQLPYYNEQFGDPTADAATEWDKRYGGNYKDYVVTGWKIISVTGGTPGSFKGYAVTSVPTATSSVSAGTVTPDEISTSAWEDGFNFADRKCTNKDLYSKSGRVFAQGGYYYVPEGVTAISIEAYWGKAVYLHNKGHYMDRVNVANVAADGRDGKTNDSGAPADFGSAFAPAGTLPSNFQTYTVKEDLQAAIGALTKNSSYTVYDQAIVLVGNVQVKNRGASLSNDGPRPFTIMSCDLDLDNEPDYCLQFQQRNYTNRPAIHPVRFDFLPIPELGLAIRTNTLAYAIGLMVPRGHFEITETSFMHTTQFEYDADGINRVESPIILNGGHFEQIVVRQGPKDKVSYFLLGGHFRMKRFTPGLHASNISSTQFVRHCVVNAIGGDYPEFYLSGIYNIKDVVNADNPHCYINGGKFGTLAGAGYEQVDGDVTFEIDHAIIREFYGGGINAAKPVTGKIDVTINNSLVDKYCGGPMVGKMTEVSSGVFETVTTKATGTTFGVFYGGGNGGTSYYRENKYDNTREFPTSDSEWTTANGNYTPKFNEFTPLNQENVNAAYKNNENENWGYHAEYEFEVFNASNGLNTKDDVIRLYYRWAQFGTTVTGDVTSTLTDCTIIGDFFGGGNLANVKGNITSILKGNTHVNGSAFAGGYSASIPSFPVHEKSTVKFPKKDNAGNVAEQGSLKYYQDGGKDRMYTWCYKNASGTVFPEGVVIPPGTSTTTKQKSVFRYPDTDDGKWYVLTTESLEDLGAVSGNATITLGEDCVIDGSVYGGGDASAVKKKNGVDDSGNTTVILQGNAQVYGNVFGGGNEGLVEGSATVTIRETPPVTPPVTPDPEP